MEERDHGSWVVTTVAYCICGLILLPLLVMVATSVSDTSYVSFPPEGFTLKWYPEAIQNQRVARGFLVSLQVSALSALLGAVLGVLAGLSLERLQGPTGRLLTGFFLLPLTIPMIVFAIGTLFFLETLGIGRTIVGLVFAHTVVTFPYSVRMITAARQRSGRQLEAAAAILGASPWQVFWRITLPTLRAGIVASLVFGFLLAFNFLTIALFVSGIRTQTLPLVVFSLTTESVTPMVTALGTLMAVVSFAIMLVLERKFGIYDVLSQRRGI